MVTRGGRRPPGEAADLGDVLSVRAFRYAQAAAACTDLERLSQAFQAVILTIGMTASASGMISGPRRARGDIFHFTNWPKAWRDLYDAQGFLDRDPVPRWAVVSGAPIAWSELLETLAPDDPGHEIYAQAKRVGFVEGFVTPVRGPDGSLGLVSVGGDRPRLLPQERLFLQSISVVTLLRAEALCGAAAEGPDPAPDGPEATFRRRFALTAAEWRVASALYDGVSLTALAESAEVSVHTVRAQLRSVYAKTGAHRQSELLKMMRLDAPRAAAKTATT